MIWPQQTITIRLASVFWVMPDTENYERKTGRGEQRRYERQTQRTGTWRILVVVATPEV